MKLDAALSAKLEPDAPQLDTIPVFLRTAEDLPENARKRLLELGADPATGTVFPLDLSKEQVSALSDESWVTAIRLARISRPMAGR